MNHAKFKGEYMDIKREFIIKELMEENFIENETDQICLEEKEDTGKSVLKWKLLSGSNFSIKNVDKKNTILQFFDERKGMYKRVDHIIFENLGDNDWKIHLVEMKSSVKYSKWKEVKAKFRASYLLVQAIAAMLSLNIKEVCMYTTYERCNLDIPETIPAARRPFLGQKNVSPLDEWQGTDFGLNFGERVEFMHTPIQMVRNEMDILQGEFLCS